jgi:VanZ family protein
VPVIAWVAVIASFSTERFSDAQTASWLARIPFVASLGLPLALVDTANLILRKSMHFVEYALLGVLTYRALGTGAAPASQRGRVLAALALAAGVAISDEVHQAFTLSRSGRAHDVLLDAAGALAGAVLAARKRLFDEAAAPPAPSGETRPAAS